MVYEGCFGELGELGQHIVPGKANKANEANKAKRSENKWFGFDASARMVSVLQMLARPNKACR